MKLTVHVKTGAKKVGVELAKDGSYVVRVIARPEKGRANDAVIRALSAHLDISQSRIEIERGATSKLKLISIA